MTAKMPDVPLPTGAVPAEDLARSWADYDNEYRIVYGEKREIRPSVNPTGGAVWVEPCAVQMADGSIQPRGDRPEIDSGPSVSVEAHWEQYLTAAEARQLAQHIEEAAAVVERWDGTDWHVCEFDWCTGRWRDSTEHFWVEYVTASLRSGDPYRLTRRHDRHRVGIGMVYEEGETPAIIVHIDGGQRDDDVDAHLKITEAVELRALLDRAITSGMESLRHMVNQNAAFAE